MDREQVAHTFHAVEGAVRVNMKVKALDGSGVTELNEVGPTVTAEDLDLFVDLAIDCFRKSAYVVLSGSLPQGLSRRFLQDAGGDGCACALHS